MIGFLLILIAPVGAVLIMVAMFLLTGRETKVNSPAGSASVTVAQIIPVILARIRGTNPKANGLGAALDDDVPAANVLNSANTAISEFQIGGQLERDKVHLGT